jgi:hypothetical protein
VVTPYIGITDFMTPYEVCRMEEVFLSHAQPNSSRRLHVGVMMSYKTLHNLPTKWTDAFPRRTDIRDIFLASPTTYNCLHYADPEGVDLYASLSQAIRYGGPGMHALQLDMSWPDAGQVACALLRARRPMEVILQVGERSFAEVDNDPMRLVERLLEYGTVIHRVLLDKSMGRGIGMDAPALLPYLRVISRHCPHLGLVVAGGLGPRTLHLLSPLLPEFADISIDAQSKLRASGNALHPIDWPLAEEYLIRALMHLP